MEFTMSYLYLLVPFHSCKTERFVKEFFFRGLPVCLLLLAGYLMVVFEFGVFGWVKIQSIYSQMLLHSAWLYLPSMGIKHRLFFCLSIKPQRSFPGMMVNHCSRRQRHIPRPKTNMTMENPPWMKMYFLLKMGIFQCHVSLQGSIFT